MMDDTSLDAVRQTVLDRMERANKVVRLGIIGGALFESALFVVAILLVDWTNRVQMLMFLFAMLSYSIIVLGLIALAGHVSRVGARVLHAVHSSSSP
jgi:hypothetical protein